MVWKAIVQYSYSLLRISEWERGGGSLKSWHGYLVKGYEYLKRVWSCDRECHHEGKVIPTADHGRDY